MAQIKVMLLIKLTPKLYNSFIINNIFYLFLIIPFCHLFFYQINFLNINKPEDCLKIFKSNNVLGLIVCMNILVGKLF